MTIARCFWLIPLCCTLTQAATPTRRDAEVTVHIRRALRKEPRLAQQRIIVLMRQGKVTLKGDVKSREIAALIEKITNNVQGVLSVQNDLNVHEEPPPTRVEGEVPMLPWFASHDPMWALEDTPAHKTSRAHKSPLTLRPPDVDLPVHRPPPTKLVSRPKRASTTAQEIEKLRLRYPRLHRLRIQEENGLVVITGSIPQSDLLQWFAQQVASITGVQRVRIRDVEIDR